MDFCGHAMVFIRAINLMKAFILIQCPVIQQDKFGI